MLVLSLGGLEREAQSSLDFHALTVIFFWNRFWLIELFSLNRYVMVRYGLNSKLLSAIATPLDWGAWVLIRMRCVSLLWADHIPEFY